MNGIIFDGGSFKSLSVQNASFGFSFLFDYSSIYYLSAYLLSGLLFVISVFELQRLFFTS